MHNERYPVFCSILCVLGISSIIHPYLKTIDVYLISYYAKLVLLIFDQIFFKVISHFELRQHLHISHCLDRVLKYLRRCHLGELSHHILAQGLFSKITLDTEKKYARSSIEWLVDWRIDQDQISYKEVTYRVNQT